jgi:hypothetical protein
MKLTILAIIAIAVLPASALAQTWTVTPPRTPGGSFMVQGSDGTVTHYSGDGRGNYMVQQDGKSGSYNISGGNGNGGLVQSNGATFGLPIVPPANPLQQ